MKYFAIEIPKAGIQNLFPVFLYLSTQVRFLEIEYCWRSSIREMVSQRFMHFYRTFIVLCMTIAFSFSFF